MTGFGSVSSAVEAMKRGARTYLTKPFDPEELFAHLREIEETLRLQRISARAGRGDLVGSSDALRAVYEAIDTAAASAAPALVVGETGTGKEPAARAIHDLSPRASGPFIAVNLGAIPKDLCESELFGHEPGAFTGASKRKRGRFALAQGGTLFLDEINSLPVELQPKLLRAIETREIWPLGGERPVPVAIGLIAATNEPPEKLLAEGRLREDLFYRLNVIRIDLPPLERHAEDIPAISRALIERMNATRGVPVEIDPKALAALITASWPGNVRQLGNTLEKAAALALRRDPAKPRIVEADLGLAPAMAAAGATLADWPAGAIEDLPFREAKVRAMEEWTKRTIRTALEESGGNVSEAARRLKINRNALFRLIARHGR
jgi:DNA-binding NtrC family response regulator